MGMTRGKAGHLFLIRLMFVASGFLHPAFNPFYHMWHADFAIKLKCLLPMFTSQRHVQSAGSLSPFSTRPDLRFRG